MYRKGLERSRKNLIAVLGSGLGKMRGFVLNLYISVMYENLKLV